MTEREFEEYLGQLSERLGRAGRREDVAGELRDHLEEQLADLLAAGVPQREAIERALSELGAAPRLAQDLTCAGRRRFRRSMVRWSGTSTVALALVLVLLWAMWPQQARVPLANSGIAQTQPETAPAAGEEGAAASRSGDASDESERQIEQSLLKPVDASFQSTPLSDAVQYLADAIGVPIEIDVNALAEQGLSTDQPVALTVRGLPLELALNRLTRQLDLTWTYRDEALEITTVDRSTDDLPVRVYDVQDLVGLTSSDDAEGDVSFQPAAQLTAVIESCYRPETWSNNGGNGLATIKDGSLIVTQSWRVQRDVARMLGDVRQAAAVAAGQRQGAVHAGDAPISVPLPTKSVQKIWQVVNSATRLDVSNVPLAELCGHLSDEHGVDVTLDQRALDESGISPDLPISVISRGARLRSILNRVARQHQLAWIVADDSIVITSINSASERLTTRFYPIGDLVGEATDERDRAASAESVLSLIRENLGQGSSLFAENGGPAQALPLSLAATLAISQTDAVHDQITKLLTDLRASRKRGQPLAKAADPRALVLQVYHVQDVGGTAADMSELATMIKHVVAPDSWESRPDAYVNHFASRLVVRQTLDVQRRVQRFLTRELRLSIVPQTPGGGGMGGTMGGWGGGMGGGMGGMGGAAAGGMGGSTAGAGGGFF